MAFVSSSSGASTSSLGIILLPPSGKHTHNNIIHWKAQVLSTLKGAQLAGFIESTATPPDAFLPPKGVDKKEPRTVNPEYATWMAKDQTVLSYLLPNIGWEILAQVSTEVMAATAWTAIQGMFASQSRVRLISTRMVIAIASKGTSSMSEYFTKMKSLADDMAST